MVFTIVKALQIFLTMENIANGFTIESIANGFYYREHCKWFLL